MEACEWKLLVSCFTVHDCGVFLRRDSGQRYNPHLRLSVCSLSWKIQTPLKIVPPFPACFTVVPIHFGYISDLESINKFNLFP